jgi:putative hemolysin
LKDFSLIAMAVAFILKGPTAHAAGQDFSITSYRFEEAFHIFTHDPKKNLTITQGCVDGCLALQSLKTVSSRDLPKNALYGGKNPGAVLCLSSAKGQVVFGTDQKGRNVSFCKFNDGSMVSSDSLNFYAAVNDAQKAKK